MEGPREKIQDPSDPVHFPGIPGAVSLRDVKSSDIDEMMAIERTSFTSPWSSRFFHEEIQVTYAKSLLAEIQRQIVGYIIFWQLPKEVDIHNLAVHPAFRRQGIGRRLLSAAIEKAKGEGAERVTLEVRKSNQAAQNLYHSLGFQDRGIRKGYYSDDGEDALIMVLDLEY